MPDPAGAPGAVLAELDAVSVAFGGTTVLDRASLALRGGEVVGLVGESGSGKTTLCRALMGLVPAASGEIRFAGARLRPDRAFRRQAQMLLQDAAGSLSPRMTVRALLEEPIRIHGLPRAEAWARMEGLLRSLGLPQDALRRYPHQISGGQARRVAMARALILEPRLLVADEPTAGLDLSVQGEILNLLLDQIAARGLACLVVSHNLDVVRRITGRVAVMYLGQVVEEAPTAAVYARPAHPYAAALLSTNPAVDPARRRRRIVLSGEIPSVARPPPACRFHTRCPAAQEKCRTETPELREIGPGRIVRCHFPYSVQAG